MIYVIVTLSIVASITLIMAVWLILCTKTLVRLHRDVETLKRTVGKEI